MQVEMSLAEMLMNAIAHGNVHGLRWKRGAVDEKQTFADLQKVIQRRLDSALSVAREQGFREMRERDGSPFKLKAQRDEAVAALKMFVDMWDAAGASSHDIAAYVRHFREILTRLKEKK